MVTLQGFGSWLHTDQCSSIVNSVLVQIPKNFPRPNTLEVLGNPKSYVGQEEYVFKVFHCAWHAHKGQKDMGFGKRQVFNKKKYTTFQRCLARVVSATSKTRISTTTFEKENRFPVFLARDRGRNSYYLATLQTDIRGHFRHPKVSQMVLDDNMITESNPRRQCPS